MDDYKLTEEQVAKARADGTIDKLVKVRCYRQDMYFKTRHDAELFFLMGMACCDSGSSEHDRYTKIYTELKSGVEYPNDGCN